MVFFLKIIVIYVLANKWSINSFNTIPVASSIAVLLHGSRNTPSDLKFKYAGIRTKDLEDIGSSQGFSMKLDGILRLRWN